MAQAMEQRFATQMQQTQALEQSLQTARAESRADIADMAQSLQKEMAQSLQKEMAEMASQMQQDMVHVLRAEMKSMLQNEMQDTLAPIMQWRDRIDTKLTAYDVTLADYTTSHNAVQQEVSALAKRLDSLAPSIQDVMTQLEATGDTAKDIRAELADAAQNIRAELAEQERRLKDRSVLWDGKANLVDWYRSLHGTRRSRVRTPNSVGHRTVTCCALRTAYVHLRVANATAT